MKKVILVRHGKSSWADPDLDDHDRPLAPRGRRAAPVIAGWLASRGHLPDRVLCSSSRRTRETLACMAEALPGLPEAEIDARLYHAAPSALRDRLAALDNTVTAAMVVGHNPGLSALTRRLTNGDVRPGCARAFEHFPTAAAAVLTFDIADWSEIRYESGQFVDFARPRELEAGG